MGVLQLARLRVLGLGTYECCALVGQVQECGALQRRLREAQQTGEAAQRQAEALKRNIVGVMDREHALHKR